ncbi:hypothetical protein BGW80DRAFT_328814 [Lactifluus volemus]|nr:hypothetical protein BGW80DRAFT_328814 [Lactifluus volemus]
MGHPFSFSPFESMAPTSSAANQGVFLLEVILNSFLCGIITQQHYLYWAGGFKDPIILKILIVAQNLIAIISTAVLWVAAWNIFITVYDIGVPSLASTWGTVTNSACQALLIIMANTFLAFRIYTLTGSRLKTGLVFGLSFAAFLMSVPVSVIGWILVPLRELEHPLQRGAAVLWHTLQAIVEFLIMYFLSRALLGSRSGIQGSDQVIRYLVRSVIQIGLFAMIWAIAGLATYFLEPNFGMYALLDATSGLIYTHMIYDGLLSRPRLRGRIATSGRSGIGISLPSQSIHLQSLSSPQAGRKASLEAPQLDEQGHGAVPFVNLDTRDSTPGILINRDDIFERKGG